MGTSASPAERAFNQALIKRVRRLRVERKWTQRYVSDQLRVDLESYKKYEKRTPLPPYLFDSAAKLYDVDINYIVTGLRHGEVPGTRLVEIPPVKKSKVS